MTTYSPGSDLFRRLSLPFTVDLSSFEIRMSPKHAEIWSFPSSDYIDIPQMSTAFLNIFKKSSEIFPRIRLLKSSTMFGNCQKTAEMCNGI